MDDNGLTGVSYTYQWIRVDGGTETNISSATSSTYILVDDDQGKTIKVKVSFTDDASNSETLTSVATATVTVAATFISNTGQTSGISSTSILAIAFTTGTGTYTLSSVGIFLPNAPTSSVTPQVQIYGDTGGNPGTLMATMTNPNTFANNAVSIFTDPANTPLSASTTYWVVTSNSAATNGAGFQAGTIANTNLDSGTAAGWSIGGGRFKLDITTTTWSTFSTRLRFEIRGTGGTTTNTPAAGAPAITAPNVFRVPAVLGVDLSGITDTEGVTGIATTATYKWQRFNAAGDDAGNRQHRNGSNLHTDRHGRDQDAEGGGQLHRRRQQQ